jgi:TLC domain
MTSQNLIQDDIATIQRLLEAPVYLSADHVLNNVLPTILLTMLGVTAVYLAAFPLAANRLFPKGDGTDDEQRRRLAYQITNGVTNSVLGLLGLYFQYAVLAADTTEVTTAVEFKIQGAVDMHLLGSIQIGFQIWSILMGTRWVKESTEMLVHHYAVILASSKSVFLTNGFRWYAPMALGMTELSSVPLSLMNFFKNNAIWRERYPRAHLTSRLLFSLFFLIVRIGMFVPQHLEYLRYAFLVTYFAGSYEHVGLEYRIFMSVSWLGALFLLGLQLYWAHLIVKGLSSFALKSKILETKKTN